MKPIRIYLLAMLTVMMILPSPFVSFGQDEEEDELPYLSSWTSPHNPTDANELKSALDVSAESYIFERGQLYTSFRLALYIRFGKQRHMLNADIPFAISDVQGSATQTGFSDIHIAYQYVFYRNLSGEKIFQTAGLTVETFAPTGKYDAGLSREGWVFMPGFKFGLRVHPRWAIYPSAVYQFSADSVMAISIATPPGTLPRTAKDASPQMINSLLLDARVAWEAPKAKAWISLSPAVMVDFYSGNAAFALKTSLGKMLKDNFGLSFGYAAHVTGQRSYKQAFNLVLLNYF